MEVLHSKRVMDDPFKKNAKYSDLDSIPEGWVGELVDGNLHASPRPRSIHAGAIGSVHLQLGPCSTDRSSKGWVILIEPEIRFGKNLLVPDLAGWRRSRMPTMPDVATFKLAPDWVCEGLSPSTVGLDKGRKREIYGHAKVGQDRKSVV